MTEYQRAFLRSTQGAGSQQVPLREHDSISTNSSGLTSLRPTNKSVSYHGEKLMLVGSGRLKGRCMWQRGLYTGVMVCVQRMHTQQQAKDTAN